MPYNGKTRTNINIQITNQNPGHQNTISRLSLGLAALFVALTTVVGGKLVSAQSLQQQINNLNNQNQVKQSSLNALSSEAGSYQEAIAEIQGQIDAVVGSIRANETLRNQLSTQIQQKTDELTKQKSLLSDSIRAMYIEDDMSTLEMVVTSKSLSDYLDKAQYRQSVQNKINSYVEEIKKIQAELTQQKVEKEALIAQQHAMQSQLSAQRAEQSKLLSLNQAQQNNLSSQMKQNSARISNLRELQAAENARIMGANGGRILNVPDSTGYPWANVQPFPNSYPDPWGMYKRQCVSYTAWKVYKDGKFMPYWGGRGNAKNWANNARNDGIPVYSTPRRGDIAVSTRGTYGHVMYVEQVLSNGMMRISQYNASWDGRYSEAIISSAGLEFVRFRAR